VSVTETDVLIAGAGPTGLVLAIWLARLGVRVRIVDPTAEPGTTSRALVVQARTLEFYRQVGLADAVIERGLEFAAVNIWAAGRKAARVPVGRLGEGLSPYSSLWIFAQDQHERLLIDRLAGGGVEVERRTELLGFEESGDRIRARIRRPDGSEEICEAAYLAGCDGAHSAVRRIIDAGFPGGTYSELFYVADVRLSGPVADGELHIALDDADFLGVFPMKGPGSARLIGTVRRELQDRQAELTWDDVQHRVVERLKIEVERVHWFSTYHVHHRVASHFRRGRAFLLGDAAHIHSPVGGQGMNTGIGDAVNLAWKLASVVRGTAGAPLLDTYEPERIAFARRLVATTDRIFTVATSRSPIARLVRLQVVPRIAPALIRMEAVGRFLFRTVSQIGIDYRSSRLSSGSAGGLRAGDRLPWTPVAGGNGERPDNFEPLESLDWQAHVYGEPVRPIADACRKRGLALLVFPWDPRMGRSGLARNALYLVRPDGYVGLADPTPVASALERYLDVWAIRPRLA
jgi:2-polyprenyl-6-methoxyphenol hydroxylase-like FAD-dependent oxidoreductase